MKGLNEDRKEGGRKDVERNDEGKCEMTKRPMGEKRKMEITGKKKRTGGSTGKIKKDKRK